MSKFYLNLLPVAAWIVVLVLHFTDASTKKGIGIGRKHYFCQDEHVFNNVHWWYDWQLNPSTEHQQHNCSQPMKSGYVPMVWGAKSRDPTFHLPVHAQYVLGFNEPDHAAQSNLTPEAAAVAWKNLESKAGGKVLVSPAFTDFHWMDQFLHACNGCRVDHVATHVYSCNAVHTMDVLHNLWNRYHKPIWLTEFSCPHTTSAEDQLNYMKDILPRLESAQFVFRYAWFVTRRLPEDDAYVTHSVSLLKPNSSQFTPLGQYYNNFMH